MKQKNGAEKSTSPTTKDTNTTTTTTEFAERNLYKGKEDATKIYAVAYKESDGEFGVCDYGFADEREAGQMVVKLAEEKFNDYLAEHLGEQIELKHDEDWARIEYPDGSTFECKVVMVTVEKEVANG